MIVTIHQPNATILNLFDRIVLMSEGNTIYNGCPGKIADFYGVWNFKMSKFVNPADKLINIASAPWSELTSKPSFADLTKAVEKTKPPQWEYTKIEFNSYREISYFG